MPAENLSNVSFLGNEDIFKLGIYYLVIWVEVKDETLPWGFKKKMSSVARTIRCSWLRSAVVIKADSDSLLKKKRNFIKGFIASLSPQMSKISQGDSKR